MVRSPCSEKLGLKKGPWTPEEDQKLLAYIQKHGHGSWRALPAKAGLQRCGKSCRLRWTNYLRPDIKRGKFNFQEERTIIQLHALLGNRWSAIATHLPKRTDNEIKNYWNTHLKKRLDKMGIDPVTHRPKADAFTSCTGNPRDAANLSHMAQWESARLEAEARLVRESKLIQNQLIASSSLKASLQPPRPQCLDVFKAWQKVVSGMFFAASGGVDTLESPTSPLNFSESSSVVPISTIGCKQENYSEALDYSKNNNNNNNNNNNASGSNGEVVMASNAWSLGEFVKRENEDYNSDEENIMEGLLDVLAGYGSVSGHDRNGSPMSTVKVNDGNSGADGNIDQDNKDYWSSLLNVVDTPLMF